MFNIVLIVILMTLLALVTGRALDLRTANLKLQDEHDWANHQAAQTIASLRYDIAILGAACDRWAHFDRVATRKMSDQAKTIHDLTTELDELKVSHAKVVLGGTELDPALQQAIDSHVEGYFGEAFEHGCH